MDDDRSKKELPLEENIDEEISDLQNFKEKFDAEQKILYAERKSKVIRYRTIFITFGIIFVSLSAYIFTKSPIWIMSGIKPYICLFTFLMGIGAFTIAIALRYEKEAVRSIYHKSLSKLNRAYVEKKGEADHQNLEFGESWQKKSALKIAYRTAQTKMKHEELDALHLMDKIVKAPSLNLEMKEKLFNQALEELQNNLDQIIQSYRSLK